MPATPSPQKTPSTTPPSFASFQHHGNHGSHTHPMHPCKSPTNAVTQTKPLVPPPSGGGQGEAPSSPPKFKNPLDIPQHTCHNKDMSPEPARGGGHTEHRRVGCGSADRLPAPSIKATTVRGREKHWEGRSASKLRKRRERRGRTAPVTVTAADSP